MACAHARLGGPCRRIPAHNRASQLRLGSGGGRLGSRSVVSELEQAMGRRPAGSRPSDASAGAPGPWRSRCHRFRLPLTVGSESICVLGPHTHTHGAGRHGEVHPWGAVGVPSATARPCSVRVAAGRLHAGAGPGAVCRLPCGRRSGASSSCRAPARPRRHALSRTEQGFLRGLCRAPIRAYALGRRRSRRAYGREPRAASR